MAHNQPDFRPARIIMNPFSKEIITAENMMAMPGFSSDARDFAFIYRQIAGMRSFRIEARHNTMFAYLAEPVFQKRFVRNAFQQDYTLGPEGQTTHLIELTRLAKEGDDNRRFLEIRWFPNFRISRPEFDVPESLRLLGPPSIQARHLHHEILKASAEAYCRKLKISPALRRIIRCFGQGKITVKEMEKELGWSKDTVKEYRSKLTLIGEKLAMPALDSPLKVALWLYQDGLR